MHTGLKDQLKAKKHIASREDRETSSLLDTTNQTKHERQKPALSHANLGYLVFFSDASLLACRGINQHKTEIRTNQKESEPTHSLETKIEPKGYTAVNGYFVVNAVARSGPGIQK